MGWLYRIGADGLPPISRSLVRDIYDGEVLTMPEFESETSAKRKIYAYETSKLQTEDTDLRLVILPKLLPDGSDIDFQAHPLAAANEPGPGTSSNTYRTEGVLLGRKGAKVSGRDGAWEGSAQRQGFVVLG